MVWWISLGMENNSPGGQDEAGRGAETGRGQWRSGLSSWLCRGPFLRGRRWDGPEGPSFQAPSSHSVTFLSRERGALYPAAHPLQPFWMWGLAFSEQSGPPPASGACGSWGAHLRAMSHGSLPSFPTPPRAKEDPSSPQL